MHRILPLLPLLLTLGCFQNTECTAMGCISFYALDVIAPSGSAIGDLLVSSAIDGEAWDVECPGDEDVVLGEAGCGGGTIVFPYTEEPIELTVTNVVGTLGWSGTLHPEYTRVYPNGVDCEPMCYQGGGEIELEEL